MARPFWWDFTTWIILSGRRRVYDLNTESCELSTDCFFAAGLIWGPIRPRKSYATIDFAVPLPIWHGPGKEAGIRFPLCLTSLVDLEGFEPSTSSMPWKLGPLVTSTRIENKQLRSRTLAGKLRDLGNCAGIVREGKPWLGRLAPFPRTAIG